MHFKTKLWFRETTATPVSHAGITLNREVEAKEMLSRPNIYSKEFIVMQHNHEVQGLSVSKPLQSKGRVYSKTVVLRANPFFEHRHYEISRI